MLKLSSSCFFFKYCDYFCSGCLFTILYIRIYFYFSVEGDDYSLGPHTVLFDNLGIALPTMLCTSISTIDDNNVEGPHTFTIDIMSVSLPTSVSIQSPSQQSATISDNDGMFSVVPVMVAVYYTPCPKIAEANVGFSQSTYVFVGGAGSVNLVLVVSLVDTGILECPVEVMIEYMDGPKASM